MGAILGAYSALTYVDCHNIMYMNVDSPPRIIDLSFEEEVFYLPSTAEVVSQNILYFQFSSIKKIYPFLAELNMVN